MSAAGSRPWSAPSHRASDPGEAEAEAAAVEGAAVEAGALRRAARQAARAWN